MRCETAGSASTGFTVLGGFAGCTELTVEHCISLFGMSKPRLRVRKTESHREPYWTAGSRAQTFPKVYGTRILPANISARFCIFKSRCLVHGGTNHEKTCGRTMYSRSVVRLSAQSNRATKSAFPTCRSHGSSSAGPGPNYSADVSAIGSQSAGRPARGKSLYGNNCHKWRCFGLEIRQ